MEIRKGKYSVTRKYGFRRGGGINHARYDHKIRPTCIDVVCPKCGGIATAIDVIAKEGSLFSFDMSPSWEGNPFSVTCRRCDYKSTGLGYFDLPTPYHQVYVFGHRLWAWNQEHLHMIYLFLKGEDIQSHPYEWLATYIHGDWKKRARKFVKEIDHHVKTNVGSW